MNTIAQFIWTISDALGVIGLLIMAVTFGVVWIWAKLDTRRRRRAFEKRSAEACPEGAALTTGEWWAVERHDHEMDVWIEQPRHYTTRAEAEAEEYLRTGNNSLPWQKWRLKQTVVRRFCPNVKDEGRRTLGLANTTDPL